MNRTREKTKVECVRFNQMLDELKDEGMTQGDFASAVGVTGGLVSSLKVGRNALSVPLAKEIERAFPNYRAAWLLGLDERPLSPVSKVDALKVLVPMVSTLSPERIEALLEYVKDFIMFELRKERG